MKMQQDFTAHGEIIGFRHIGPEEGNLTVKVKIDSGDLNLECFVYGETLYDLSVKKQYRLGDFVEVRFSLLSYDRFSKRLGKKTKSIVNVPESATNLSRGNIDYMVQGEVLQVVEQRDPKMAQQYVEAVLNCGIYIHTDVSKLIQVKVGDYLRLAGRLDAHIVGKVN